MAITRIPEAYKITCDGCGLVVESSSGHRPNYWTELSIVADAHDFQGCAVADASVKRLLCGNCTSAVHAAINKAISEHSAALGGSNG